MRPLTTLAAFAAIAAGSASANWIHVSSHHGHATTGYGAAPVATGGVVHYGAAPVVYGAAPVVYGAAPVVYGAAPAYTYGAAPVVYGAAPAYTYGAAPAANSGVTSSAPGVIHYGGGTFFSSDHPLVTGKKESSEAEKKVGGITANHPLLAELLKLGFQFTKEGELAIPNTPFILKWNTGTATQTPATTYSVQKEWLAARDAGEAMKAKLQAATGEAAKGNEDLIKKWETAKNAMDAKIFK